MKEFLTFLTCFIGLCPADDAAKQQELQAQQEALNAHIREQILAARYNPPTPAGHYLAARFAQRQHDWKSASRYVDAILKQMPEDLDMQKRAMVLAMGAGEYEQAMTIAKEVYAVEANNPLAALFSATYAFKQQDYEAASKIVQGLPDSGFSHFMTPLLHSWAQASVGVFDIEQLGNNAIHVYHSILIADLLEQEEAMQKLLHNALQSQDMTTLDLERIGDLYAHVGLLEDARDIYEKIFELEPDNTSVEAKLETIENGGINEPFFTSVSSAREGLARTMFDMGRLLYSDYNDESAKIFAQMALYLSDDMPDIHLLLGSIAARNGQADIAIAQFNEIGPQDRHYFEARQQAAEILEAQGRTESALAELKALVETHGDLNALLQIGDVHRRAEDFAQAIEIYNRAERKIKAENGGALPRDYWHLYYVRGMSYEQNDQWAQAEKDLLQALEYQPEHPFVLNYLGYSWADQGVNLDRSLDMIRRAVALRPQDGYITDSLGWVLYRLGRYEEAIPHLERAVELLPDDPIVNDHLGDAYWVVGRKREARFQWTRAKNYGDDEEMLAIIADKMINGVIVKPLETNVANDLGQPVKEVLE